MRYTASEWNDNPDNAREPNGSLAPDESVLPPQAARPLRQQQENQAFAILELFWRQRRIIAGACFAAVMIGGVIAFFVQSQYTAEVLLQPRLAQDPKKQAAGVDAASLIETEVDLIQSRATAERVVDRLGLSKDPALAVHESLPARTLSLFMSLWPSREKSSTPSRESMIAAQLMKNVGVTHARSYLIRVSYTSTSPGRAVEIAKAFADEYVQVRSEVGARQELADLASLYGTKHPAILGAHARLDDALRRSNVGDNPYIVAQSVFPSGPNRRLILGLALLGGLMGGISIVLIRERAVRGFRTDVELATETNLPCLGMVPETSRAPSHIAAVDTQTAHAIIMAAGVSVPPAGSRVLLITSSVPDEGKSVLAAAIARTLNDMRLRTLTIDLSPKDRKRGARFDSPSLEDVVKAVDLGGFPLDFHKVHASTVLCSDAGPDTAQKLITSSAFTNFLSHVREVYDVVIVEAPPVMLFADAFYLSRFADFQLHVVRWSSTPRRTVAAALERMRNLEIRTSCVVLSRVNQKEYRLYTGLAEHYYRRRAA
jgi:Mrp family chromosome partitioning ATPase